MNEVRVARKYFFSYEASSYYPSQTLLSEVYSSDYGWQELQICLLNLAPKAFSSVGSQSSISHLKFSPTILTSGPATRPKDYLFSALFLSLFLTWNSLFPTYKGQMSPLYQDLFEGHLFMKTSLVSQAKDPLLQHSWSLGPISISGLICPRHFFRGLEMIV